MFFKPYALGLPASFTQDVQDFVKNLYHVGQTALQNRDHRSEMDKSVLNPFALTIQSNVVCIELLLWAVREEAGKIFVFESLVLFVEYLYWYCLVCTSTAK